MGFAAIQIAEGLHMSLRPCNYEETLTSDDGAAAHPLPQRGHNGRLARLATLLTRLTTHLPTFGISSWTGVKRSFFRRGTAMRTTAEFRSWWQAIAMPEAPGFAIVNIRCTDQIDKLRTIPNLIFQR